MREATERRREAGGRTGRREGGGGRKKVDFDLGDQLLISILNLNADFDFKILSLSIDRASVSVRKMTTGFHKILAEPEHEKNESYNNHCGPDDHSHNNGIFRYFDNQSIGIS